MGKLKDEVAQETATTLTQEMEGTARVRVRCGRAVW